MKNNIIKIGVSLSFVFLITSCKSSQILPDPLEAGWNGEKVCVVLNENKQQRILKCTFKPGIGHEEHYHKPHFGYTVAGSKFQITDAKGTRTVQVKTGTTFKKEILSEHAVLNVGDSTAVFLIIEKK